MTLGRNVPTLRCPSVSGAGRSPRSTSWRSWPLTTLLLQARRVRCCAGRACIPVTLCSGGRPATPARWLAWPFRADVSGAICRPSGSPRLEAEKQQLEQELAKTRLVVDVQAKRHALVERLSESAEPENGSTK